MAKTNSAYRFGGRHATERINEMNNSEIIRVDIVDEEGYDGDRILSTRYLINADLDKVLELKEKTKNRDRFMACENKELEFESIDDVEYAIDEAFEQVKVIKVEIPW